MALEGGTRLVRDEGFGSFSVVRSLGLADLPRGAEGSFGFVAGRVPEDVVVAHGPVWDGTVDGRHADCGAHDVEVQAVVIITSPFHGQTSGAAPQTGGRPRIRVPAYCCYTTSAEQTTDGSRRFLLLAHDRPGRAGAARQDERGTWAEVWCAVVDAAPGSGEPAVLVAEARTDPAGLAATRARLAKRYGTHQAVDLPATGELERAAHAAAVRCALTHQHKDA